MLRAGLNDNRTITTEGADRRLEPIEVSSDKSDKEFINEYEQRFDKDLGSIRL